MVEIENLSVTYPDGTKAVEDFSMTMGSGESVALIGANGAGKTTLIMALVGILGAQGRVSVDGVLMAKETMAEIREKLGVVFQNPDDQLFMSSIYDDAAFGLRNGGMAEADVEEKVDQTLNLLHIPHLKHKTALKLSGGEKRMAAIATVLVMNPSVMIFDEPTAFLDPKARRGLIHTLNSLDHGKLIATHDLAFAAETCRRTVLIKDGRIFADGPSLELLWDRQLMDDCGVEAIGVLEGGRP